MGRLWIEAIGPLRLRTIRCKISFFRNIAMKFIELSGTTLQRIISDDEVKPGELARLGVTDECVVRINRQGDIELRRADRWEIVGGLLGEFEDRIKRETGLGWL
jgi:hypothetical protein